MNLFFRLFILFLAHATFCDLQAAGSGLVRGYTVHFDANGTITRIVSPGGQINTPGNLANISEYRLLELSSTRIIQTPTGQHTINWSAFVPQDPEQQSASRAEPTLRPEPGMRPVQPPETVPPITLDDNDSSRFIPSGSSLATALVSLAIIYAGERTEPMSAIGNGIMDSLSLEKLHAYLEKNAPVLLKRNKITAATVATLAIIIDHLLTTTSKTRYETKLGQIAQLSLCGWATYRTVEKLLTQIH